MSLQHKTSYTMFSWTFLEVYLNGTLTFVQSIIQTTRKLFVHCILNVLDDVLLHRNALDIHYKPGPKKLWNFEARARIGLQRNLDFINKNVRLVIRTPFQKLRYYFCCINGLKIHSCFTAILNASLTINLNGICMKKSINMRVKFEARILIFPSTGFHFPSTSVPPGTFLGSATNVRLDSFMSLNMLFKVTTVAQLLLTYVTREPSTFIVWLQQMSLELITPCKTV